MTRHLSPPLRVFESLFLGEFAPKSSQKATFSWPVAFTPWFHRQMGSQTSLNKQDQTFVFIQIPNQTRFLFFSVSVWLGTHFCVESSSVLNKPWVREVVVVKMRSIISIAVSLSGLLCKFRLHINHRWSLNRFWYSWSAWRKVCRSSSGSHFRRRASLAPMAKSSKVRFTKTRKEIVSLTGSQPSSSHISLNHKPRHRHRQPLHLLDPWWRRQRPPSQ